MMKIKFLIINFVILFPLLIQAELRVSSILGDNMVLQRNTEIKLWGKANPDEKLKIVVGWSDELTSVKSNKAGDWIVKIKTTEAGGPYSIKITSSNEEISIKNVLLGEVWVCSGQSNMEMPVEGKIDQPVNGMNEVLVDAENDNLRLFTVQKSSTELPQETCVGEWQVANSESVAAFSAVGYFYARELQQRLKMPVGIICTSWGGSRIEAWIQNDVVRTFPEAYAQTSNEKKQPQNKASHLYNGMIYPILNYRIKGAIWYQGESNIKNYKDYAALMEAMIGNWRESFGVGDFPFYFVQIAPFGRKNSTEKDGALQRDEQLKASLKTPNTGMVSIIDIGEENCIHPAEKLTVGKRLSYWALSETYGIKGLFYKNPIYKSMTQKDDALILSFENTPMGITAFGKEISNFEISGTDKIFYPAIAKIKNSHVIVSSTQVENPVAVRYCFYNYPQGKGFLYNTAGLPVPSFRSDDWDVK